MLQLVGLFLIALESGAAQIGVEREVPVHAEFYRPPSKGPALAMITSEIHLDHSPTTKATLVLPIVPDYTGQKLVSLDILCNQPTAAATWKIRDDATTHSRQVVITLGKARDGLTVGCKMFAIAPGEIVTRTQNKDFDKWLGTTSIEPDLQSDARGLKTPSDIVKWVAGREKPSTGRDLKSLWQMGDYGRAFICTSLLRMHKISARLAEVVLTWATGRESRVWMTEYVDEDGIWQMADPTVGISKLPRNSYFVISIPERSTMKIAAKGHFSERVLSSFPAPGGGRLMLAAASREAEVLESAKKSRSLFFPESDLTAAARKGVSNLSLYLLGRPTLPDSPKR